MNSMIQIKVIKCVGGKFLTKKSRTMKEYKGSDWKFVSNTNLLKNLENPNSFNSPIFIS